MPRSHLDVMSFASSLPFMPTPRPRPPTTPRHAPPPPCATNGTETPFGKPPTGRPTLQQCSVGAYAPRDIGDGGEPDGEDEEEEEESDERSVDRDEGERPGETAYRGAPASRGGRVEGAAVADAEADDTGDSAENRLDFVVTVKYVRREIRTLTDRDRETFFNAISVMQRVPGAVGRQVYGSKYYSKDYFNRMHLYYGERARERVRVVLIVWREAGATAPRDESNERLLVCVNLCWDSKMSRGSFSYRFF